MLKARTLFLSDIHIGSYGCQAGPLLEFLKQVEVKKIVLIGDIIDGWRLKNNWFFPQAHINLIKKFISLSKKGVEIIYVPGNHDEFLRGFHDCDIQLGNIKVKQKYVHRTLKGHEYLIVHGDAFEAATFVSKHLSKVGSLIYNWLILFNKVFNMARAKFGLPYWSISKFLKQKTKEAVAYIYKFEEVATKVARNKGYKGIICGHIHTPAEKLIEKTEYWNTGDWVESCSYIYEDFSGQLHLDIYVPAGSLTKPITLA